MLAASMVRLKPCRRIGPEMDVLFLLIPLSVLLVFLIIGAIWWAIYRGQFDDLDREAERILDD